MIDIPTMLVMLFFTYYTLYIARIIFLPKTRKSIQYANTELNKLRQIPVKTLEEQKRFLNLKYPKTGKTKITWRTVGYIIINILVFILFFQLYNKVFEYFNVTFSWGWAIIIVLSLPLALNFVLMKFNVQANSVWDVIK